jgi:hypothetical protein
MIYLFACLVYLPVNSTVREDTIRLFAMVGTGYVTYGTQTNTSVSGLILNYKWNIKIRQIDCKANDPFEGNVITLQLQE